MKYEFIRDHASRYTVNLLCCHLGVKRRTYYDWRETTRQGYPAGGTGIAVTFEGVVCSLSG